MVLCQSEPLPSQINMWPLCKNHLPNPKILDSFHVITGRISTLQGGRELSGCTCKSFSSCLCPKFMEPSITEKWNINESLGTFMRQKSPKLSWRFSSHLSRPIIHKPQALFVQRFFPEVCMCHFCGDILVTHIHVNSPLDFRPSLAKRTGLSVFSPAQSFWPFALYWHHALSVQEIKQMFLDCFT